MPVYFSLTNKKSAVTEILQGVDDKLYREVGGIEPDEEKWFYNWYNEFGYSLASGKSFDELKKMHKDNKPLLEVIDYLDNNYILNSGYSKSHN